MVSLTSLLVLTGLLTQTSQSIPKTAYMKRIDVWYTVFIFIDFLIIIDLAVIEGLRQRVKIKVTKGATVGTTNQKNLSLPFPDQVNDLPLKLNRVSLVVFPLVFTIFLIIFFIFMI